MPQESPSPNGANFFGWRYGRRVFVGGLLFAVIFAVAYCSVPVQPYVVLAGSGEDAVVVFSPDGNLVATAAKPSINQNGVIGDCQRGPIRVWHIHQGIERLAFDCESFYGLHFSPDGKWLAADESDGKIRLWNTATGEEAATIRPVTPGFLSFVQFSPDNQFLVFEDDTQGPLRHWCVFWNIDSKKEQGGVWGKPTFAADGSFATFDRDSGNITQVFLWRTVPSQAPVLMKEHRIKAHRVSLSPDLRMFASAHRHLATDREVVLWDMMTGEKLSSLRADYNVTRLSFEAGGRILKSGSTVFGSSFVPTPCPTFWDVSSTPRFIGSFDEGTTASPNGQWLAVPRDAGSDLLHLENGETTSMIVPGDRWASWHPIPFFSPDSKTLAIGRMRTGEEPFLSAWLPAHYNPFPPRASVPLVRVWDVTTGRRIMTFMDCESAQFSPDGQVMASTHGDTVRLWRLPFRKSWPQVLGWATASWIVVLLLFRLLIVLKTKWASKASSGSTRS